MTTVEALKAVYVSLGGELTDIYSSIADGAPVSDYVIIPDVIAAISQKTGGSADVPPVKWVNATRSGNTITFDGETQKSIYQAVESGSLVIIVDNTNKKLYYPQRLSRVDGDRFVSYLSIQRGSEMTTYYDYFSINGINETNTANITSANSDDYQGSGPI